MSECQITEHIPKNKGKNAEGKQFVLFAFHTFPCDTGREPKNMLSHKRLLLLLAEKGKVPRMQTHICLENKRAEAKESVEKYFFA